MNPDFSELRLDGVTRRFAGQGGAAFNALSALTMTIKRGEFIELLGPSGCGKSTALNCIAGLLPLSDGSIMLDDVRIDTLPPERRGFGMVFQNYALFPHLSVERNVGFGLEQRKLPRPEIAARARRALELVRLAPDTFARRMPSQLSGGQRQRVALARALVLDPAILLLDEPLGAVDLKVRKEMQLELKALNRELGTTFVYVTHDQEEALTMSDRIAVFNHGQIEQVGTPAELYEHPATAFVAGFLGVSNLVSGPVAQAITGSPTMFSIRPEKIHLTDPSAPMPADSYCVEGRVREVIYLGMYTRYLVELTAGGELTVMEQNLHTTSMDVLAVQGRTVRLTWRCDHVRPIPEKAS